MLGIGIDDLLYLGETGYVDFIYHIEGMWVSSGGDKANFDFLNFEPDEFSHNKNACIAHTINGRYNSPILYFYSGSRGSDRTITVDGFLAVRPFSGFDFYQKILRCNSVPVSETAFVLPVNDRVLQSTYGDNPGFAIDLRFSDGLISLEDLFISFTEITRIQKLTSVTNPSSIAIDAITAPSSLDDYRKERPVPSPRIAPKTANSQLEFIHALLKVFCPQAIERPTGRALSDAFTKKGLEMPVQPKTIANWLKQLDEK